MNAKNPLRRFVNDGLVGTAVVIIIFGILVSSILIGGMPTLNGATGDAPTFADQMVIVLSFLFLMFPMGEFFVNPMPFIMLIAFIGSGVSGRFIDNITARRGWIKPMVIVSLTSWLAGGVLLAVLFFLTLIFLRRISPAFDAQSFLIGFYYVTRAILIWGGFGVIAGLVLGCLAGLIFNPGRRLYKIIIVSVSIAFVGLANGFGLILIQGSS